MAIVPQEPISAPNVHKLMEACGNPAAAMNDLVGRVIGGSILVVAQRAYRQSNGNLMAGDPVQITAALWKRIKQDDQVGRLWLEGAVSLSRLGKHGAVDLSSIAFERAEVMAVAEMHRPANTDALKKTGPQGPNAAGRYGMPLAYVTMHLSTWQKGKLRDLTNIDAGELVTQAFDKLGMRAPHSRHTGEMGGGIRDALLNMRDSPWDERDAE